MNLKRLGIIVASICLVCGINAVYAQESVKIGVLAKRGNAKCLEKWKATADYLTKAIEGKTFEIVPLPFEGVNSIIKKGEVDFFLVNSSIYITTQAQYGTSPVATMVNSRQGKSLQSFGGVIITSADNDEINSLEDLKEKSFIAVKESSFGGWQMAYKEFVDSGIDPFEDFEELEFAGSHDAAVVAVQSESFDAGTVRTDTLERMVDEGKVDMKEFKIIHKQNHEGFPFVVSTALYPEWPLGKLSTTSDEMAKQVLDALKKLTPDDEATKSAKIVGWVDPLDYQGVEELQKTLKIGAYKQE